MPGVRRAATNSNLGTNINQLCQRSERERSPRAQQDKWSASRGPGGPEDEGMSTGTPRARSSPRAPSAKAGTSTYMKQGDCGPGVRELLMHQLAIARQDLTQRTQQALEQMENACMDSMQLMEATNMQLRRENERLHCENERLHSNFGTQPGNNSSHMGGTGESPALRASSAPARPQPQNGQEPVQDSTTSAPPSPSKPTTSLLATVPQASSVAPPVMERPAPPTGKEGPPTMAIPGTVPDGERPSQNCDSGSGGNDDVDLGSMGKGDSIDDSGGQEADALSSDDGNNGRPRARRRSVFVDADKMKQKVREAIVKKEYDVKNAYKDTGIAAWIAKSALFDHLTLTVICINAVWIAVDMDLNTSEFILDAHPIFQIAEFSFCGYFTLEVIIRFIAFNHKRDCLKDAWFVFDFCLVMTMLFDTGVITMLIWVNGDQGGSPGGLADPTILRMFRMLKLTRMARMVRLLRAMPELMILIKGIVIATRSVCFTLALLLIFIYLFAILFRSLTEDSPLQDELFPNIPAGMLNLLMQGTLPDHEALVMKLWDQNVGLGLLSIFFILLASLTVMNMLVGVLVEVVGVVSTVEKEQMNVQFVYSKLQECLTTTGIDADGDQKICKAEFESLLLNPKAARMVQEVGVDVVGLVDFSEYLFQNDATLSFPEFMDLVLQLRGSNTATVKDVVDLRKFISSQVMEINDLINNSTAANMLVHKPSRGDRDNKTRGGTAVSDKMEAAKSTMIQGGVGVSQWAAPRPSTSPTTSSFVSGFESVFPTGDSAKRPRSSELDTRANSHLLDEEV